MLNIEGAHLKYFSSFIEGNSKDAPDDGGNGNRGQRKSDWICDACGAKVFGSKSICFKCNADKGILTNNLLSFA